MKSKKKIRFPKRELNSWLRSHHSWGESEWQELLQELNKPDSENGSEILKDVSRSGFIWKPIGAESLKFICSVTKAASN